MFVTTPESLPISVVRRFIKMVEAFNIPTGGVFVNMRLDRSDADSDPTGYLAAKLEEQEGYLKLIRTSLGEHVAGYVKMYPTEVRGTEALQEIVKGLRESRQN